MIEAKDFIDKLKNGDLNSDKLLEFLFTNGYAKPERFPNAFDSNGKLLMDFQGKKGYHTWCPLHDNQKNGDAFFISNKEHTAFCYNKSCGLSKEPMDQIQMVMLFALELDYSIVFDFELRKSHFWNAARFLVEHFGDDFGVSMADLKSSGTYQRNFTEEILRETTEYYHFLATKTSYNTTLKTFLSDTRHFKHAPMPVDEMITTYKLGITPRSDKRDMLYKALLKRKYTKEQILESKVCIVNKLGEIQDFFISRAIVPYIHKGKVIGLYGRELNANADKKYRHMRLEGKVRIPNGLDGILDEEEFFLVEGEFSKLAVASLNYTNVMEARGTNGFKTEHAELIQRVRQGNPDKCKRCYMMFDPDDAGADSVKKIGHRLISAGVEVLVCRLPVLYQEGEAIFVDPNDLLKIYEGDAKDKFDEIKKNAVSLDAFLLIHEMKKDAPSTLSEARMVMNRFTHYFDSIHPLERIFLLEEVLELMETAMDKTILRGYLQEVWLHAKQKLPVEGYQKAITSKEPFIFATKSEELFEKVSSTTDAVILVRDVEEFMSLRHTKNLLIDITFSIDEQKLLSRKVKKVVRGKIHHSEEDNTFEYEPIND